MAMVEGQTLVDLPCPDCKGELWVCENHPNMPWRRPNGCMCGAGAPCKCNPSGPNQMLRNPPGWKTLCEVDDP